MASKFHNTRYSKRQSDHNRVDEEDEPKTKRGKYTQNKNEKPTKLDEVSPMSSAVLFSTPDKSSATQGFQNNWLNDQYNFSFPPSTYGSTSNKHNEFPGRIDIHTSNTNRDVNTPKLADQETPNSLQTTTAVSDKVIKVILEPKEEEFVLKLTMGVKEVDAIEEQKRTAALLLSQADMLRHLGETMLSNVRAHYEPQFIRNLKFTSNL